MMPRHLTDYHVLWFHLRTVVFLENPKIRQTLAQDLEAGHQIEPNPQLEDKNSVQRCRNIIHILFTATGISMFHIYIRSLQCAIACSRARCAAAARNHNKSRTY